MHRIFIIICATLFFVQRGPAQPLPHAVVGSPINNHWEPVLPDDLLLECWLADHPDETLSGTYLEGWFQVEVSDFGPWEVGEDLVLALGDQTTGQRDTLTVILTEDPVQNLGYVHLEAEAVFLDNPSPVQLFVGDTLHLDFRLLRRDGSQEIGACEYFRTEASEALFTEIAPCRQLAAASGSSQVRALVWGLESEPLVVQVMPDGVRRAGQTRRREFFRCYPTVTRSGIELWAEREVNLRLFDVLGRCRYQGTLAGNRELRLREDLHLAPGIYFLRAGDGGNYEQQRVLLR